jgi:hypothetical protein
LSEFYLLEVVSDVAPGVAASELGRALDGERKDRDGDV